MRTTKKISLTNIFIKISNKATLLSYMPPVCDGVDTSEWLSKDNQVHIKALFLIKIEQKIVLNKFANVSALSRKTWGNPKIPGTNTR